MADTLFTKIINGDIPCDKVYEDNHVLAFLDINPLADGHTLVIPKEPAAKLHELSPDAAAAVGRVLPAISRAICEATGVEDYNILQNNGAAAHQAVDHVHFHIIPKPSPDSGLGIGWPGKSVDSDISKALAAKISAAVRL